MARSSRNGRGFFQLLTGQRCLQSLKKRCRVRPRPRRAARYRGRFAEANQSRIRVQLEQDAATFGLDAVGGYKRLAKRYAIWGANEAGYSHGKGSDGIGACASRKSRTTSSNAVGCSRCTAWPASGTT